MVIDEHKSCPRCNQQLHVSFFYRIKRKTGDGYSGYCKKCMGRSSIDWQKSNLDKMQVRWAEQALDKRLKRAANGVSPEQLERERAAGKKYRDANREHVRKISRESKARQKNENPEEYRAAHAIQCGKRRCLLRGYPTDITVADWRLLLEAFDRCCAYCGGKPQFLDLDHIIPIDMGGFNVVGNIVPICRPCNSQKSRYSPEEFSRYTGFDLTNAYTKARVRESPYPTHAEVPNDNIGLATSPSL